MHEGVVSSSRQWDKEIVVVRSFVLFRLRTSNDRLRHFVEKAFVHKHHDFVELLAGTQALTIEPDDLVPRTGPLGAIQPGWRGDHQPELVRHSWHRIFVLVLVERGSNRK